MRCVAGDSPFFPIVDPALIAAAREALAGRARVVLGDFSVAAYIRELDAQPPDTAYHVFSAATRAQWDELLGRCGGEGFALVHGAVMVDAIARFAERLPPDGYPDSILACFRRSYERILGNMSQLDLAGYQEPRDLMFKDLGLCRQTLMPGGARVIEPVAAFPRSILLRGGWRQFFAASRFLLFEARGNAPFFNLHTHDFELNDFNEAGWTRLFLRIADLLRSRPYMKGVFVGAGWLYDPKLPSISPRLGYHLGLTLPNGARSFFYEYDDEKSYAFAKSETRRRLFEEGKYRPALHVLIWPRKQLLAWASTKSLQELEPK
jgi:hypothetical protein